MMIRILLLILLLFALISCEMIAGMKQHPSLDIKLTGVWKGEHLEEGGTLKSWTQTRNPDGTYSINFSFKEQDGTVRNFTESGQWWIKEGLFHEITPPQMGHPDKYRYSFKDKDCVRFDLVESEGYAEESGSYVFTECLIADSPPIVFGETI